MKVFVTGGAGFFGSWLIPKLEEAEHEVFSYDKKTNSEHRICNFDFIQEKMKGFDAVIHLAAIPHAYPEVPSNVYRRVNTRGALSVALASIKVGINK